MSSLNRPGTLTSDERPLRDWNSVWGWSATSVPVAFLLTVGIALGPQGINLLSTPALPFLSPIIPVALTALGVLVGLSLGDHRPIDGRMFAGATIVAAIMIVTVSAGLALLAWTTPTLVESVWTLAFIAGICAATSLTLPAGTPLEPQSPTTRIIEAGVVLPISAGGLLLAWLHTGAPAATLVLLAQAFGVTLALATAGWLVLTRVSSPTEERVFALSALLLIGGAADALVLSALLAGLTAGVFWRLAGGRPREIVGRDVLFVQHSLLVLVLLVAGATAEISLASIAVGGLYTLLRILGAFAGGAVARRVIDGRASGDLSRHLLRPGVFGVAFAVNAAGLTTEAQGSLLLTGIVVGTIGAEVAARFLWSSPSNP